MREENGSLRSQGGQECKKGKWLFCLGFIGLLAVALMGCVAAIPVIIHYYQTSTGYVATAEVKRPEERVYAVVVMEVESAGPGMKIIKRDGSQRLIEISDGTQTASIMVIDEDTRETEIVVTASLVDREKQKELALRVLLFLCNKYGEDCRVREN